MMSMKTATGAMRYEYVTGSGTGKGMEMKKVPADLYYSASCIHPEYMK